MKVRLKRGAGQHSYMRTTFQFHEGPIKTETYLGDGLAPAVFQFHEGPIKTRVQMSSPRTSSRFQFHEGPIKTEWECVQPIIERRFNSMKVRLKPVLRDKSQHGGTFQFHEGPIKTNTSDAGVHLYAVSIP